MLTSRASACQVEAGGVQLAALSLVTPSERPLLQEARLERYSPRTSPKNHTCMCIRVSPSYIVAKCMRPAQLISSYL